MGGGYTTFDARLDNVSGVNYGSSVNKSESETLSESLSESVCLYV